MARAKKLTVKYFPRKSKKSGEFSIYCRITYDKKSTMFVLNNTIKADSLDEAKKQVNNLALDRTDTTSTDTNTVDLSVTFPIKELVQHEIDKFKGNYSIVGFGERLPRYSMNIGVLLRNTLLDRLFLELEDILSFRKYSELSEYINSSYSILVFFKAIRFLKEAFDFELNNEIKKNIFPLAYSCYSFNAYSYENSALTRDVLNSILKEMNEKKLVKKYEKIFEDNSNFLPLETVLEWTLNKPIKSDNTKKIKDEFSNFLKDNVSKKINEFTDNDFEKVFPISEFSYINEYSNQSLINRTIEKYIDL